MVKKADNSNSEEQAMPNPIPNEEQADYIELIGKQGKEIERQGKLLNWTFGFIVAVLLVCFIAFVTFLLDAWRFHQESYIEFTKTLEQVNIKLTATPPSPTPYPKR